MFIMPEHCNLVSYLLDHGFTDVWSLDWRGSMRWNYDLFPTNFSIDDTALYDIPAAFAKIREIGGEGRRVHVICHCLGSVAFFMSLYAGLVDGITSIVSNSVSITPRLPRWSYFKLCVAPFLMNWILRFPCLNPRWSSLPGPGVPQGKLLAKIISMFHPECNVPACHMLSFMWGSGRPGIYRHENLDDLTHRRTGDLFGAININYYLHVRKMARHGVVVKMRPNDSRYDQIPNNYLDGAAAVDTPILFVTGDHNRVFLDSNKIAFDTLAKLNPNHRNRFELLKGYGHQDPFMGKNSHVDVFPKFVEFIESCRRTQMSSVAGSVS
jgi:triacylglycerol lipase/cholesterol oxidase